MGENKEDDTQEIDLERCINKEYGQIEFSKECRQCEGYNYNCVSYYPLAEHYKKGK